MLRLMQAVNGKRKQSLNDSQDQTRRRKMTHHKDNATARVKERKHVN